MRKEKKLDEKGEKIGGKRREGWQRRGRNLVEEERKFGREGEEIRWRWIKCEVEEEKKEEKVSDGGYGGED